MNKEPPFQTIRVQIEKAGYQIMGQLKPHIWCANHKAYGNVVIKLASTRLQKLQLKQEAEFLTRHQSNHWVPILEYEHYSLVDWAVLPQIDGINLGYFSRKHKLSNKLIRSIERGLLSLHQYGYIHGDINPSNIMVSAEDRAMLIDFGGTMKLNAPYPKYVAGNPKYSRFTHVIADDQYPTIERDWFSLAVTLASCTASHPFGGNEIDTVIKKGMQPQMTNIPSRYQMILLSGIKART
ncbi:phosphotransferase [Vibrio sp. SCSIO 43135]|uniref:protein kinase domain-containing protein n=1 Tax=Vibrio sp. SCSIO 43135 TaxID=2819096 RepID=UPI0020761760|nr:phosphotransferase [Vibrio sp. SCSIO 43135]USD39939.1 phosphotransferase [Vibrio sp. SCSIO 43135]